MGHYRRLCLRDGYLCVRRGHRVHSLNTIHRLRFLPLVLFIASCSEGNTADRRYSAAQAKAQWSTVTYVTMLRNTAISVTLADSIDTDVHRSGAGFRATLTRPIVVDRDTVFIVGAGARGIMNRVIESGGHRFSAEVQFCLTALQDTRGQWIRIGTHAIQERRASSTSKEIILVEVAASSTTCLTRLRTEVVLLGAT